MTLHKFSNAKVLLSVADDLHIKVDLINGKEAKDYIDFVLEKYKPWKLEGHLSISDDVERLDTEENEFTFSLIMKDEPAYIFFEQNHINKNAVIIVENAKSISLLMKNSHGMEYFVSNKDTTYLVAVNWYSIEFKGDISLY